MPGAAVAVRLGKIAHRLAADQIILQLSVYDQLDRLRRNALVVHVIGAHQPFAVVALQAGIIHNIQKLRQHARMIAGGKRSVGAGLGAQLGPRGRYRAGHQRAHAYRRRRRS